MKDVKIKDWFLFGEWFDIYWHHAASAIDAHAMLIKEYLGYGLSQVIADQEKNIERIYFSRSEWTNCGKRFLDEIIAEPKKLEKLLGEIRNVADQLIIFSEKLKNTDTANFSESELVKFLAQYHELHHPLWALGQIPNLLELENSFLSNYLRDTLRQSGLAEEDAKKVFQVMSMPRELSRAQKEEREMLRLATIAFDKKLLEKHWREYSWLHFGWTGPSLTLEYFEEVNKGLRHEGRAQENLEKLFNDDKNLPDEKLRLITQYNISAHTVEMFRLLEELLFIKAHRMDALFMSYEAMQPLLKTIAKKYFLSLPQVYVMYIPWLLEMIKNNDVDAHKINAIADYSVRYFDGEKFYLLTGDEARKFIKPLKDSFPPPAIVNELKGECAFAGKVTGRVCVVNRAAEMDKFKDGDVLVSNVTDPSLLPIMKKASAFVTNQGGLTCHAAIVARELKVPCVIGTKTATRVFKDGDMVEVDAGNGIVKKI